MQKTSSSFFKKKVSDGTVDSITPSFSDQQHHQDLPKNSEIYRHNRPASIQVNSLANEEDDSKEKHALQSPPTSGKVPITPFLTEITAVQDITIEVDKKTNIIYSLRK